MNSLKYKFMKYLPLKAWFFPSFPVKLRIILFYLLAFLQVLQKSVNSIQKSILSKHFKVIKLLKLKLIASSMSPWCLITLSDLKSFCSWCFVTSTWWEWAMGGHNSQTFRLIQQPLQFIIKQQSLMLYVSNAEHRQQETEAF